MEEYKLFGFFNMFDIVPDFIFPIFERKNILYMQEGENDKLCAIVPLKKELYGKVVPVNKYSHVRYLVKHLIITTASSPQYAFQASENEIIYGDSKVMLKFLKTFHTNDEILMQEISDFREDVRNGNVIEVGRKENGIKFYGNGRKKRSIAKVYLRHGTGNIEINKRDIDEYFDLEALKVVVKQPLIATNTMDKFDVVVKVHGGEHSGQAGAIRLGISRALLRADVNYKYALKKAGFFTRRPHVKERKKY